MDFGFKATLTTCFRHSQIPLFVSIDRDEIPPSPIRLAYRLCFYDDQNKLNSFSLTHLLTSGRLRKYNLERVNQDKIPIQFRSNKSFQPPNIFFLTKITQMYRQFIFTHNDLHKFSTFTLDETEINSLQFNDDLLFHTQEQLD